MKEKKFQFLSLISIPRKETRDLLTCIFYEAETEALDIDIIVKTFAEVGLWPWNPHRILEICQEHYCKICELKPGPLVRKLLCIIREIRQLKMDQAHQKLRSVTRVAVEIVQKKKVKKQGQTKNLQIFWKAKSKKTEKLNSETTMITLSSHPKSVSGKCEAMENHAVQKVARRPISGQRSGQFAPSVK